MNLETLHENRVLHTSQLRILILHGELQGLDHVTNEDLSVVIHSEQTY